MKKTLFLFLSLALVILFTSSSPESGNAGHGKNPFRAVTASSETTAPVMPGSVILKFRAGTGFGSFTERPAATGMPSVDLKMAGVEAVSLLKRFRHRPIPENSGLPDLSRIYRLTFANHHDPVEVAALFSGDPAIEYAEPEPVLTVTEVPDDALYGGCQHLPQIMAEEAWEIHKGEDGDSSVVIAIVDTGTDWHHEDLADNTWQNMGEDADGDGATMEFVAGQWQLDPDDLNGADDDGNGFTDDLIGWDFHDWATTANGSNPDPQPWNPVGAHGSHTSGIAAGTTNNATGIASVSWNLKHLAIQATNGQDNLQYGYDGIIYAAEQGADIISNSWGALGTFYQAGAEAIAYATGLGSIVLCAAGNNDVEDSFYPANYPGVISVASVNVDDTKADYSNFGTHVDVAAPGGGWEGGILSTIPGNAYAHFFGTSMATPMAAGLAGLIKSFHPDWSNEQIITQLLYTADPVDSLNPGLEHMLGTGRINAFLALSETGVTIPQELEFSVASMNVTDENSNNILEAGEDVVLDITLKNCAQLLGCTDVTVTLVTADEDLQVTSGPVQADFGPDGFQVLNDAFQFHIAEDAASHIASFELLIEASYPVVAGSGLAFDLAIAPSGILVLDLFDRQRDLSGNFISGLLDKLEMENTYTQGFPHSLKGFETVFISFPNVGLNLDQGFISNSDILKIALFLTTSQQVNVYIEGGSFFIGMYYSNSPQYATMCNYFGVQGFQWPATFNHIGSLEGVEGSVMEGIQFTRSGQLFNFAIDAITPKPTAFVAFTEEDYGNVAVHNQLLNRKTFYLGYALAEMEDVSAVSSRNNVLLRVLDYFGYNLPEHYVLANFTAGDRFGKAPLEVQFNCASLRDYYSGLIAWQWDLNGDGVIDSGAENPVFTYDSPGNYDVMLVATSSSGISDTLYREAYVCLRDGMFVFETAEGQRNFSGTFIRDFLLDHDFNVDYSTTYPLSFAGYDAIFLSQGFMGWFSSTTPDGIVEPLLGYLETGGKVYAEGGDVLGHDLAEFPVHSWFGLSSATHGEFDPVTQLEGQAGTLAEGMVFSQSNQTVFPMIDRFVADENGLAAFVEDGEPVVAVQHAGGNCRTVCFSYALAELADNVSSTREGLLTEILEFFGYTISGTKECADVSSFNLIATPNPFRGTIVIGYELPEPARVEISLYNMTGERTAILSAADRQAGKHRLQWDAGDLPSGVYLIMIRAGVQVSSGRVVLMK